MSSDTTVFLPDESSTQQLGARLAQGLAKIDLPNGAVIHLQGDLGAGKTTLVRALLKALGHQGAVKSPTYSLVESYRLPALMVHHFDFYRFESEEEFFEAGLQELFDEGALCLVEWPDKAGQFLPPADWVVRLNHLPEGRECVVSACSALGEQILMELR